MAPNRRLLVVPFLIVSIVAAQQKQREIKPGFNFFSKEQDVQMGREAAAQVERQMAVLNDSALTNYISRLGRKLATQPEAGDYPYSFKVVQDPSINAFALPGGPAFVHTGLIAAADNEAQLVGVLAHEMSHVALRHGTNQVSKANIIQLPAMLAGSMMGGSLFGQLSQLGIGLGANSLLLKFSRNAERDADLLGARMMAGAGYNPIEMARFFEKLEAEGGSRGPQFLSDHPNPGNRVKAVEDEVRFMAQRDYNGDTGEFAQMKQRVARLKAAPKRQQSLNGPAAVPQGAPQDLRPTGSFRQFNASDYTLSYPESWEAFGDREAASTTIAPRSAIVKTDSGTAVGYGVIVSFYIPPDGEPVELQRETANLIRRLQQTNSGMRPSGQPRDVTLDGQRGIVTTLYSTSPYPGQREVDMLVTVARPQGLFYMVFIAPENEFTKVQKVYEDMLKSVRFRG